MVSRQDTAAASGVVPPTGRGCPSYTCSGATAGVKLQRTPRNEHHRMDTGVDDALVGDCSGGPGFEVCAGMAPGGWAWPPEGALEAAGRRFEPDFGLDKSAGQGALTGPTERLSTEALRNARSLRRFLDVGVGLAPRPGLAERSEAKVDRKANIKSGRVRVRKTATGS
jgi:hypothetical protein